MALLLMLLTLFLLFPPSGRRYERRCGTSSILFLLILTLRKREAPIYSHFPLSSRRRADEIVLHSSLFLGQPPKQEGISVYSSTAFF